MGKRILGCQHTWVCTTGGTSNARVAFKRDSWLLWRMTFVYESTVRRAPLDGVSARNGRVGMVMGEGLHIGDPGHTSAVVKNSWARNLAVIMWEWY